MTDLDEFIEGITDMTEHELGLCEPDQDIEPALFVFHGDDLCESMMVGGFMTDETSKAVFAARVLPATLRRFDAKYFAMVSINWVMTSTDVATIDQFQAWCRDNPDTDWGTNPIYPPEEVLVIVFGARDGTVVLKSSLLERSEDDAPECGEWAENRVMWTSNNKIASVMVERRMVDFAMEAMTGVKLVTEEGFHKAAKALSASHEIKAMVVAAWEALGMTPEEGLRAAAEEGPGAFEKVHQKLREIFPDYEAKVKAMTEEHLPDAAEEYLADAGAPDGMVVMVNNDGEIEPLASFLRDDAFQELLDDDEDG